MNKYKFSDYLWPVFLTLTILLVWCWVTGRVSWSAWAVPIGYGGDGFIAFGNAKAYFDGDTQLFFQKYNAHLNAPFVANWNDWPITEDLIFASIGWLGRVFGLFFAGNIILCMCHLLAGLSFWYCGKELRCKDEYIFLGAICFAFCPYIFVRGFGHIPLTFYWYIPWLCLISWWAAGVKPIYLKSRRGLISILFSAIAGSFNPYYSWMYLMFLGFAVLRRLLTNKRFAYEPILLILITAFFFLLFNLDTLSYKFQNGENLGAVSRNFTGLELYGLKLPELFLPASHKLQVLSDYAHRFYYDVSSIRGEMGSPYLGFFGILSILTLLFVGLIKLLKGDADKIHPAWWQLIWVTLYSLIGGINLMFGSLGLVLFRGTNRFSIYIFTLSLLFFIWFASKKFPNKWVRLVSLLAIPIILWEQLPPRISNLEISNSADFVNRDKDFAATLEGNLPKDGLVFELPVMPYPESPPILGMNDYEHFRPYLFTTGLKYSYGNTKGRGDEDWQKEIENSPRGEIVAKLEKYGFSAILINKKGYADKGDGLKASFIAAGGKVIADSNDMVAIKIMAKTPAILPSIIRYSKGWSSPELGHRWAERNIVSIQIGSSASKDESRLMSFTLQGLKPQRIAIFLNGVLLRNVILSNEKLQESINIPLVAGKDQFSKIDFVSDVIPQVPGNGDPRKLAFDLKTPQYIENSMK
jgi:hypothetical protein